MQPGVLKPHPHSRSADLILRPLRSLFVLPGFLQSVRTDHGQHTAQPEDTHTHFYFLSASSLSHWQSLTGFLIKLLAQNISKMTAESVLQKITEVILLHLSRRSAGPSPNNVIGSPSARRPAFTSASSVDTVICRARRRRSNSASASCCRSLTRSSISRVSPAGHQGKTESTKFLLSINHRSDWADIIDHMIDQSLDCRHCDQQRVEVLLISNNF